MKAWIERIGLKEMKTWGVVIVASAIFAFVWDFQSKPNTALAAEDPTTASTFIPAGFVLVPIEVSNYESLDSILGKFGVVDLYKTPFDEKARPIKVASRVKILRAPLNPSHFAVLVPDSESARLVSETGAFMVVVQNPESGGTEIVNDEPKKIGKRDRRSRINVEVTNGNI